jgi:hypothetical protein
MADEKISGIDPKHHVITGEDPEEFRKFALGILRSCRPVDVAERFLVDMMIANGWRLKRYRKIETQIRERHPESLANLQQMISSIQRSYNESARELTRGRARRAKSIPRPKKPSTLFYTQ